MLFRITLIIAAGLLLASANTAQAGYWQNQGGWGNAWSDQNEWCLQNDRDEDEERNYRRDHRDRDSKKKERPERRELDCDGWGEWDWEFSWFDRDCKDNERRRYNREDCRPSMDWFKYCDDDRYNFKKDRDGCKPRPRCRPRPPKCDPIPEPATAGMSLMGLAALAATRRRRNA